MIAIDIIPGATFVIVTGPSVIELEHSTFDPLESIFERRCLAFATMALDIPVKNKCIIKFIPGTLMIQSHISGIIVTTHRRSAYEWIFWIRDPRDGRKYIISYSTQDRKGSGMEVAKFPKYF